MTGLPADAGHETDTSHGVARTSSLSIRGQAALYQPTKSFR